jgi:SAM-dependent methyltransferase
MGIALDAGCAVGRFTFELSSLNDFAIGFDYSRSFVGTARELLIKRRIGFKLKEEGHIQKDCAIELPGRWESDKVEFIVADARALPFGADLFGSVASLNLVDKIPSPLLHLKELNRVSRRSEAQFLFSDPFSWSTEVAREEEWLGGLEAGQYGGSGIDNIAALLEGAGGVILPPWTVQKRGSVWWKIRNHRNHFELIRSCYLKARR